jgi:hypothetical protein
MIQHEAKWILGGLRMAGAATLAAVGLTGQPAFAQPASGTSVNETRTGAVSAPPARHTASLPGGAALSSAAARPAPTAIGGERSPQSASVAHTPLAAGQVWQCVIDGQRIFSDAPCGEHASIRQLRELNVMDAPPVRGYAYTEPYAPSPYFPSSAPAPAFAPAPDDSDYADYSGPDVLWAHGYARRNYLPRQDNHLRPHPRPHPHPGRN